MHFDLTDLRLYLNTLDTGNITAGAARSHLSLAAASARVRAMEASLGIDLLERGRRGVTPTPAGKALAQHARVLLQHAEHLQQDLAEYAQDVKGQVRLLCNTSAMTEYLPELLASFLKAHPNLDIDLQELPSSRITHGLRQGAADLGIVSDAVDTHDLQTKPFRDDPLVLILPTGHPLADGRAVRFSETLSHDYIGLNASSALSIHLEEQGPAHWLAHANPHSRRWFRRDDSHGGPWCRHRHRAEGGHRPAPARAFVSLHRVARGLDPPGAPAVRSQLRRFTCLRQGPGSASDRLMRASG